MLNLFITGTDTGVGKTFITAGLAATMQSLGYTTCVYKPIQCGAKEKQGFMQAPDLAYIKNIDPYVKTYSTYMLKEKAEPLVAAELEGIKIDKTVIKKDFDNIAKSCDCLLTEGAGGIMTPLAQNFTMNNLIKFLNLPVLVVIKPDFGTVNQTLLTINQAISSGIEVRGVIINNFPENTKDTAIKTIPRLVEEYTDTKILGIIKHFSDIDKINPNDLITTIINGIDIESVFKVKIAKLELE
ncbi:MAG TPA: dethiobiotin synthase [Candidatus Gastranaerophilaceae bacterium]|nr:dethiobiotin synthase [Candidatus Gastranaerophilaceae bacterium]HPT41855.1 dethiobiotin synthase [Candidatus Gastranaerophilaceae bacterium]